jgi:hypothetical protein
MIYKKHELSLSLNGNEVVHIARGAAGNVVFRESSEERLKKAIDRSIEAKEKQEEAAAREKELKAKAKAQKQKGSLFSPPPEPAEETATENEEENLKEEVLIPQQSKVVRGPDGKFISKSAFQEEEEPAKKSFWDKLK